jgi:hypothetical protein
VKVFRSHTELRDALRPLPSQAAVIVAFRASKRVSVLLTLRQLVTEVVAAGIDLGPRHGLTARARAADAAAAANRAADGYAANRAADAAVDAAVISSSICSDLTAAPDSTAWNAASLDVVRLRELLTSEPTTRPTGWDDPRLGPIWPDGPPAWHRKAEEEVRKLKERLASRFAPPAEDVPPEVSSQMADVQLLTDMQNRGELEPYAGGYVAVLNLAVVGHGLSATALIDEMSARFRVPPARVAVQYVY